MIQSMTGFAGREMEVEPLGKISVEMRSTNHKFLESVFHLPEGLLSLEDKIKKEIEAKIKRGRLTCVINIIGGKTSRAVVNKALLEDYYAALKRIRGELGLKEEVGMDTLLNLPGVLSLGEEKIIKGNIWPRLNMLVKVVLEDLVRARQKEGRALSRHLKSRAEILTRNLEAVKKRFKKAVKIKAAKISSDEERASFFKESDISEETERLAFHARNFKHRLLKGGPVGKELDFIAQEMQREANTMAAKSFDAAISGRVVQMKSQIEKIREQVQNIE